MCEGGLGMQRMGAVVVGAAVVGATVVLGRRRRCGVLLWRLEDGVGTPSHTLHAYIGVSHDRVDASSVV